MAHWLDWSDNTKTFNKELHKRGLGQADLDQQNPLIKEAAKATFTGRIAERLGGYTEVQIIQLGEWKNDYQWGESQDQIGGYINIIIIFHGEQKND